MALSPLAEQVPHARRAPAVPKRKRILLAVHSAKTGGAERLALLEAEYLKERFELLVSVPEGPLRESFGEHGRLVAPAATLPVWGASPWRWIRSGARTLLDAVAMARVIRGQRVELVLTNSSVCFAAVLGAKLARVPAVVHARDVPTSRLAPLVFAAEGALAQTVIVITDGLTGYFRRGRRARVVRLADGIQIPARAARERPLVFGSPLRLCLIGGIDARKGQDIAVEALAQLRSLGVEAELELVGREIDKQFAEGVREQARGLHLSSKVKFVGEVRDVTPILDSADILVAPSRSEWTPLVLMEALAHGVPVVAARIGGVQDIVDDRRAGLLVAPEDAGAMAGAIVALTADPGAAGDMAQQGRDHVEAHFAVQRTLEGLQSELEELLASAPIETDREREGRLASNVP